MISLDIHDLTAAVQRSVTDMMAPKNQHERTHVANMAQKANLTPDQMDFYSKMLWGLVENAYMRYFLVDVRHSFKTGSDPVPACLKGKNVDKLQTIGKGTDGVVYQLSDNTVVKVGNIGTHRQHPLPDMHHEMAVREVEIARLAGRAGLAPKVIDAYYCCSADACKYVIQMSKVNGPTLRQWIDSASRKDKATMMKKTMTVLKKLHRLGISHSDLHAGNVMIDGKTPVIIDFSRSLWMNERQGKYDVLQLQGIFEDLPTRLSSLVQLVVYDLISKNLISI